MTKWIVLVVWKSVTMEVVAENREDAYRIALEEASQRIPLLVKVEVVGK